MVGMPAVRALMDIIEKCNRMLHQYRQKNYIYSQRFCHLLTLSIPTPPALQTFFLSGINSLCVSDSWCS